MKNQKIYIQNFGNCRLLNNLKELPKNCRYYGSEEYSYKKCADVYGTDGNEGITVELFAIKQ